MSWWTCVKGARKYLTGTRASDATQAQRAAHCAGCPNLHRYLEDDLPGLCGLLVRFFAPGVAPMTGWCGEPGTDAGADGCGCLVLGQAGEGEEPHVVVLTRDGQRVPMRAAGKPTKDAERCPRGKW